MAASGRVERAERTIFQLLLQEITVVLEVPKKDLRFACLFSYKYSNFWYYSCICEVTNKVIQGLSRTLLYSENNKFLLTHFQPMFHSHAPRKPLISDVFRGYEWIEVEHSL